MILYLIIAGGFLLDYIVYKYIFGFQLRKGSYVWTGSLFMLTVLILVPWITKPVIWILVQYFLCALIPMVFFKKLKVPFLIFYNLLKYYMSQITTGLLILNHVSGNAEQSVLCIAVNLCISGVVALILYKLRGNITTAFTDYVCGVNGLLYLLASIVLYMCSFRFYISDNTTKLMEWKEGWTLIKEGTTAVLIAFLFILLLALLYQRKVLQETVAMKNLCIERETLQYMELNRAYRNIRKYQHDFSAHLRTIYSFAEKEDISKIKEYIKEVETVEQDMRFFSTNNAVSDAIINQYYTKCFSEGIELKVMGRFPDNLLVKETDLCVLLSNIMSNAYEAASKSDGKKKIIVEISHFEQNVYLTVSNSASELNLDGEGDLITRKKDKEKHGIGLQSVTDTAEKNNGSFKWIWEEGEFKAEIVLRPKKHNNTICYK